MAPPLCGDVSAAWWVIDWASADDFAHQVHRGHVGRRMFRRSRSGRCGLHLCQLFAMKLPLVQVDRPAATGRLRYVAATNSVPAVQPRRDGQPLLKRMVSLTGTCPPWGPPHFSANIRVEARAYLPLFMSLVRCVSVEKCSLEHQPGAETQCHDRSRSIPRAHALQDEQNGR